MSWHATHRAPCSPGTWARPCASWSNSWTSWTLSCRSSDPARRTQLDAASTRYCALSARAPPTPCQRGSGYSLGDLAASQTDACWRAAHIHGRTSVKVKENRGGSGARNAGPALRDRSSSFHSVGDKGKYTVSQRGKFWQSRGPTLTFIKKKNRPPVITVNLKMEPKHFFYQHWILGWQRLALH